MDLCYESIIPDRKESLFSEDLWAHETQLLTFIAGIAAVISIHKRMAKREPHLFDYATIDCDQREAAARQQ